MKKYFPLVMSLILFSCQTSDNVFSSQAPYPTDLSHATINQPFYPNEESLSTIQLLSHTHMLMLETAVEECMAAGIDFSDSLAVSNQLKGFSDRFFADYDESVVRQIENANAYADAAKGMMGQNIDLTTDILYGEDYDRLIKMIDEYYISEQFSDLECQTQQNIYIGLESLKHYRENIINTAINVTGSANNEGLDYMSPGDHLIWRECMRQLTREQMILVAQFTIDGVAAVIGGGFGIALGIISHSLDCLK